MKTVTINNIKFTFSNHNLEQDLLTLRKALNLIHCPAIKSAHSLPADFTFILHNEIHYVNFSRSNHHYAWFLHRHNSSSGVDEVIAKKLHALIDIGNHSLIASYPLWVVQFNNDSLSYTAFSLKVIQEAVNKNASGFPYPITNNMGYPWHPVDILERAIHLEVV